MRWPVPATCPCGGSPTAIHGRLAALLTCGCSPPVAATSYGKQGQGGSDLKPLCPRGPRNSGTISSEASADDIPNRQPNDYRLDHGR